MIVVLREVIGSKINNKGTQIHSNLKINFLYEIKPSVRKTAKQTREIQTYGAKTNQI